jgi:hypothetical protein
VSHPIRCPYCQRTYQQFQVIGSKVVIKVGDVSLIVGQVVEFECRCKQSFIPVGAAPKSSTGEEVGEK